MYLVDNKQGVIHTTEAAELKIGDFGVIRSPLAQRILKELSQGSAYPKAVADRLRQNEQKIYYHVRRLERAGFIEIVKTDFVAGVKRQYYATRQNAYVLRLGQGKIGNAGPQASLAPHAFLTPFVRDAKMHAIVVVGSPDPHGPQHARSRDGYYGMDFALFLGSYLDEVPQLSVRLDTEVTQKELEENHIILLGGPIVNSVVAQAQKKMPIYMEDGAIISRKTQKRYYSEESGFIVRMPSPFNPKKRMLCIAGLRYMGTRACMIMFLRHFDEVVKRFDPNDKAYYCIIQGYDMDSDGIVDDARIIE